MIFNSFGRLLTIIGLTFAVVFTFFYFHGAVAFIKGKVVHVAKAAGGQATLASGKDYKVETHKKSVNADAPPVLPDISDYTVQNISAQAPAFAPGKVFIRNMEGLSDLREFVKKDGRVQRLRIDQTTTDPQAIVIQEGAYDLAHLYQEAQALAPGRAIVKEGDVYLLRMPLLVGRFASLVISDKDTPELRLSQGDSAFIVNAGNLYILKTKITGWNDREKHPSFFQDKTVYRPFIASWSGGKLYIAGSTVSSLGYRKGKSYGLTYSTCPYCLAEDADLPRPTGALAGNKFTDMYYGFYSYEADGVAIVGNVYADNAVYGIDPHDRSRHLIIANNETYGSHKKHGIIISRDVDDSWIFGNYSHNNHGSGIMLDRNSRNNVIANNIAAYNEGDGITFFESQDNRTYGNKIYRNGLSGVRIRNSWDIKMAEDQITDNGRAPIIVYSMDLAQSQPHRDLQQDPYQKKAGAAVEEAIVKPDDNKPVFKLDGTDNVALSDVHMVSSGKIFDERAVPGQHDTDAQDITVESDDD